MVRMKKTEPYRLHIDIDLGKAPLPEIGKALGVLFRQHCNPHLLGCSIAMLNDSESSGKAQAVIDKLLRRTSPWEFEAAASRVEARTIRLDDKKIQSLATSWDSQGVREHVIVVPHMFYKPLLKCFLRNMEDHAQDALKHVCLFFDYVQPTLEIISRSFLGERTGVLGLLRKKGVSFIDTGHQLFLENLISLACYIIPARYLVFMDDDFFINSPESIEKLLRPLREGYLLCGRYAESVERIHTSLFAIRPECLRDELSLFDNGRNLYAEKSMSTGTITYGKLSMRNKGVFSVGDYSNGDLSFGRHLCHCTCELWNDMPFSLRAHLKNIELPEDIRKMKLDASMLLDSLALLFGGAHQWPGYQHIDNETRWGAEHDFAPYFSRIYSNHRWLSRLAKTLRTQPHSCIEPALPEDA